MRGAGCVDIRGCGCWCECRRGRHRALGNDDEDDAGFERDGSSPTAGWTVLCNDRAVIVGDTSRLTGWGDGIPLYHPQFAILTGMIEFRSKHADKLPVTTTKRALDTSSPVWLESLVKMKEGMRVWIDYTNKWKNLADSEQQQARHWERARSLPLTQAIDAVATRRGVKQLGEGGIEFNPKKNGALPLPEGVTPSSRRITFTKPVEEIRIVARALLADEEAKAGVVGEKCFELVLSRVRKQDV